MKITTRSLACAMLLSSILMTTSAIGKVPEEKTGQIQESTQKYADGTLNDPMENKSMNQTSEQRKDQMYAILTRGIGGVSSRFPWVLEMDKSGSFTIKVPTWFDQETLELELPLLALTPIETFPAERGGEKPKSSRNDSLDTISRYLVRDKHSIQKIIEHKNPSKQSSIASMVVRIYVRGEERRKQIDSDIALIQSADIKVKVDPAAFDE